MPTPIRLLVTDMAGTTVADDGTVVGAFTDAMNAVGIGEDDPELPDHLQYVHDTMGQSKIVVFRAILGGDEDRAQAANEAFEAAYQLRVEDGEVAAIPGVEDFLNEVKAAGIKVAMTTGFADPTRTAILDHLGWTDLPDVSFSPAPGRRGRPHPDLVLASVMACQIADVAHVAVVGDTANDLRSGARAGASVVAGVLTGAHDKDALTAAPSTHVLGDITELRPLLLG